MAKDPAVLLYTSDFLSGTMTMTNEEVGMYIRLLCLQHQKGKLTDKDMLSICKAYVEDVYEKFDKIDGCYVNKRMYEESERRSKYTESRRSNAKIKHMPKHMVEHMPKHMETETETRTVTINKTKILDEQFEEFWDLYDYKKSRDKAEKAWKTLNQEEKALALQHAPVYAQSTPDKQFRKHPTTYLNNKSFNDEIIERTISTKLSYAELEWERLKNLG